MSSVDRGSVTATRISEFVSPALEKQRIRGAWARSVRGAWRLSDGREVLIVGERCFVADGANVYQGRHPLPAGAGLALQCVMATEPGTDPWQPKPDGKE